ncbi:MAG: PTS sugar transporter subunit IIA, partial [Bacillota bacterium]|nr:PTS sugar transporter subunit IIA [Bacillota bacterium]
MKQIWVEPQEIWIDAKFSTSEEALSAMANHLVNRGICKPSFVEAILNREREFPTGLETLSGIGVALPHTDAEHVLCDRLAIAILEREIPFGAMGFEQEKVEVKLIVM